MAANLEKSSSSFDAFMESAWTAHGERPDDVAAQLADALTLPQDAAQLQRFAALATHVYGEHLGRWRDGVAAARRAAHDARVRRRRRRHAGAGSSRRDAASCRRRCGRARRARARRSGGGAGRCRLRARRSPGLRARDRRACRRVRARRRGHRQGLAGESRAGRGAATISPRRSRESATARHAKRRRCSTRRKARSCTGRSPARGWRRSARITVSREAGCARAMRKARSQAPCTASRCATRTTRRRSSCSSATRRWRSRAAPPASVPAFDDARTRALALYESLADDERPFAAADLAAIESPAPGA